MKLKRIQICAIVVLCCVFAYHAVPLVEAHPALKPIVKTIIKKIVKFFKSGEIGDAHKSVEKAIQKIKDDPVAYGLTAAGVADLTADCIATFTETEDSTTYEVKLTANDDEQRFEFYVNGESTVALSYDDYNNLSEDEAATRISNLEEDAISTYKMRHPVGN